MPTKRVAAWIREHPVAADGALAVLLAAISLIALFVRALAEHMPRPGPLAVTMVLLSTLPLAWRRSHPLWINLGVGAVTAAYGAAPFPDLVTPVAPGGVVALYTMVAWCGRRVSAVVGVLAGVGVAVVALVPATDSDLLDVAFTTLLLAGAWVLGDSARIRRAYTAELEARAELLARERDFEARRAVAAERARIARELHDVVTHHVGMMVVQAEAGPVLAERDPRSAERTFDTIAETGRQAMTEMRRLLGVLREESPPGADAPQRGEGALEPQPGLAQVPELVEQARRAGVRASLEVDGPAGPLPAGVELSAYRIVQEALTNVMKHAGGARVRVAVRHSEGDLRIEVCDDGPGTGGGDGIDRPGQNGRDAQPSDEDGRGAAASDSNGQGPSGHGLIGMRERVQLFGGELTAAARPEGGFAVVARLPIGGAR
ncbi:sensor histidine kinase [Nonomuraea sp. NPDC049309]|uniref:sensor histidine kinase n=1 Tax=Nonomuraea sp. NPDC049309 TaxID=3364350 RepID=UPI00371B0702